MDWPMSRRVERLARRLHDVMERLDVDPRTLVRLRSGDAYAEARARCLDCVNSELCLRWLDHRDAPAERPDFCPNLPVLETCRREPPQGH
jgi:Family of unknown function (DUF6455)